ncbi:unnamed protein product [Symbiodinium sp. CCMP2456]|nr:unnamed protein product [Symbiodinium sp. CCMP2456]
MILWPIGVCSGLEAVSVLGAALDLQEPGVLERWLQHQHLAIPDGAIPDFEADVQILFSKVHVKASVKGLVCDQLRVGAFDSGAMPSKEGSRLLLHVAGLGFKCSGQVDYDTSLGLQGQASALLATEQASADLTLFVPPWPLGSSRAIDARLGGCDSTLNLKLQITSGTFWTKFAQYLPGVIEKLQSLVNEKLSEYLCGDALADAQNSLTDFLTRTLEESRLANSSHDAPWPRENWVDWTNHPLTYGIAGLQEQFLQPNQVYNKIIGNRCIVGEGPTCYELPVCLVGNSSDCTVETNASTTLSASLFETVWNSSDFEVTPLLARNASLAANISVPDFLVRPVFNVSLTGAGSQNSTGSFSELFRMNLSLRDVKLGANVTAGVDALKYSKVPGPQLYSTACLGPCMEDVQLTRLISEFQLQQISVGSFSNESRPTLLLALLHSASLLLEPPAGTANFTQEVVQGLLQNHVAGVWNESLTDWMHGLQSQVCPVPRGQEVYKYTGRRLILPEFGKSCCWVALFTALAAVPLAFWCNYRRPCRCWYADALCESTCVPRGLAVLLPFAIVACLFFLLGSNYLLMAQTFVNLEEAPSYIWNAYAVMVYSLFYSINALYYESDLQAMSWVLLCFSAILPYVKLILMMVSWILPSRFLPLRLRNFILVLMDDIGKFSLVDVFVVQFLSGVFHLEIAGTSPKPGSDPMRMVLRTNEELGFAAFVCATVVSLIIGHLCRHYHEKSVAYELSECSSADVELQSQVATFDHPLSGPPTPANSSRFGWQEVVVGPSLLVAFVLTLAGCSMTAFSVHTRCVFGPLGQSHFSLFQFAYGIPSFSEHPLAWPTLFNQFTFILFAIGVNFSQLILLLLLWYWRVPKLKHIDWRAVAHCLGAWSALDVALISMIITMLELGASDFVHLWDSDKRKLSRRFGIDVRGPEKGLTVDVVLSSGTCLLFVAVLLQAWASRAALHFLDKRSPNAMQRGRERLLVQ